MTNYGIGYRLQPALSGRKNMWYTITAYAADGYLYSDDYPLVTCKRGLAQYLLRKTVMDMITAYHVDIARGRKAYMAAENIALALTPLSREQFFSIPLRQSGFPSVTLVVSAAAPHHGKKAKI